MSMKYKLFGRTGLKVSEICLGTMTFGTEFGWGSTKEDSRKVFDLFLERGGNFFDTANHYTKGTSEIFLGEFAQPIRDQVVIGTKYTINERPKDPNSGGNHRKCMVQSLESSLKRLKMDYVDIYWVHMWDLTTPIEEVMRALDDLVRMGKVLYVGVSDMPAWVVSRANTLAELKDWTPFAGLQLQYSLLERTIEQEYFQMAEELDLTLTAWSPLAGGVLAGKYADKNNFSSDSRYSINKMWGERFLTQHNYTIVEAFIQVAREVNRTPSQVALNWMCQKKPFIIPIIGAKNVNQLKENLDCLEFKLAEEQIKRLDEASEYPLTFPYNFLALQDIKKAIYGDNFENIENTHLRELVRL